MHDGTACAHHSAERRSHLRSRSHAGQNNHRHVDATLRALGPINASARVNAQREAVFAFLADPDNHWRLARGRIDVLALDTEGDGHMQGTVVLRGPGGVRRRARTTVLEASAPTVLSGVAAVGATTRAKVTWYLEALAEDSTCVTLSAQTLTIGHLDRLLLAAGGRLWMRRLFAGVLAALAELAPAEATRGREDAGLLDGAAEPLEQAADGLAHLDPGRGGVLGAGDDHCGLVERS